MGISCTIRGYDRTQKPSVPQDWCRFDVVNGVVRGTNLKGKPGLAAEIMTFDPLKAMPGVAIPLSDAEAWVKALPWYYQNSSEMSAVMGDGSVPPIPTAPVKAGAASSSSEDEEAAADFFTPGVIERSAIREKATKVTGAAYKLAGVTSFQGLPISIETKKGQVRKGVNHDGTPWCVTMPADYGYIKGTKGVDGQHVDCFIGPLKDAKFGYVFHIKNDATGAFDEDKVCLGFKSDEACTAMLKVAYDNWDEIFHSVTMLPMHEFIQKVLHTGDLKKPGKIHAEAKA